MPRSSGERGWRKARAVAVSLSARLSGPTAVASKSASPSTANEPDHTGSPGPRTTGSDSPVRLASSRVEPVRADHGAVGHDLVAGAQPHEVADHDVAQRHRVVRAVAHHHGLGGDQRGEPVQRPLGAHLLEASR